MVVPVSAWRMRSSASSSAPISGTPLRRTGSEWCPLPIRSALCMSAAMARSIREISREVIQPTSAVNARPMPTTSGIAGGRPSVSRSVAATAAVSRSPTVTTVKM